MLAKCQNKQKRFTWTKMFYSEISIRKTDLNRFYFPHAIVERYSV